jgi:hypothetical protein
MLLFNLTAHVIPILIRFSLTLFKESFSFISMLEKLNSYYNAETEYRILVIDNAYNTDCIEVGGDFETCLYKFPKIEFIGTFNEFRKDIYFRSQRWNRNKEQLLEWYRRLSILSHWLRID